MSDDREELRSLILAEQLAKSEKRCEELEREVAGLIVDAIHDRLAHAAFVQEVSSRLDSIILRLQPLDPAIARASNSDGID